MGFTGVVWFPRGATRMSIELYGGPGPVPLGAASASWGALATQLTEASVILAGTVTGLAAGWRGPAGDMALASFANFGVWMGETIEHAGRMSGTTGAGAASYLASAVVMPSPAEIAITKAAMAATTVAAASTGAGLGAAVAANEAAEREMDIRATLAMEGYESASTLLSLLIPFRPAPPIAIPEVQQVGIATDFIAGLAAEAPTALTEYAGPVGGQILSHGTSATVSIATHAAGLDMGGAQPQSSAVAAKPVLPAATGGGGSMSGMAGFAGGAGTGGTTGTPGTARPGALRLGVPMAGSLSGPGGAGGANASGGTSATERAAGSSRMGGAPMRGAGGSAAANTDDEYDSPDYLRRFDQLEDGRTVVPAVIGGAAATPDAT
ncbi:PPE domain-containing protein [Tomitella biformata]|uniref:PPE domain-containing protein n=1 Tax=Tomitella biformata TaxID=630403 RepID=UPI003F6EE97D